jgi:hypothetical protein
MPLSYRLNTNKVLAIRNPRPHSLDMGASIISTPAESFDALSLKVVAVRTADNSDFQFEFPAASPPTTPSAIIIIPEQPLQLRGHIFARLDGWHHGGINE